MDMLEVGEEGPVNLRTPSKISPRMKKQGAQGQTRGLFDDKTGFEVHRRFIELEERAQF